MGRGVIGRPIIASCDNWGLPGLMPVKAKHFTTEGKVPEENLREIARLQLSSNLSPWLTTHLRRLRALSPEVYWMSSIYAKSLNYRQAIISPPG